MQVRRITLARTIIVAALLMSAGSVAVPLHGAASELLVHFVLPGGDIECLMVDPNLSSGNVECGIHRNRFRCADPACDVETGYSRRWLVQVTQVASVERSRRPFGTSPKRVLRYGQSLTVGHFRCTARKAGLTCVSRRSGHGFFLGKDNERQRVF